MSQMNNVHVSPSPLVRLPRVRKEFWFVVIGAALWGIDPLFRNLLLTHMTSTQLVFLEHILLVLIAGPVLWKNRSDLKGIGLRQLGAILFVSWGGSAIATVLFTKGVAYGDLNAVLLLQKLQPLMAILLARLVLKEALPKSFGFFVVIALAGTYLLTFGWSLPIGDHTQLIKPGNLFAIGAALLWGGSTVMGSYLLRSMKYETVTSLRFTMALPLLFVMVLINREAWTLPTDAGSIAGVSINLLLQALLPGLLSMLLYYKGLSAIKASYATLAELSFPMAGILVNWLGYHMGWLTQPQLVTSSQIIGFLLIWVVLFLISRQKQSVSDGALAQA
ncbi:DMT family transporter [Gorillibacterium sp. CAU 1737]|uniref:DMT family transporter n=1 Tax=Gorillibacterium sp. CAU 1737 TaxID=3140362 RepID=UPI00325FEA84